MADTPITVATAQVLLVLNSEAFRTQLAAVLQPMTKTVTAAVRTADTGAATGTVSAAKQAASIRMLSAKEAATLDIVSAKERVALEKAASMSRITAAKEAVALQKTSYAAQVTAAREAAAIQRIAAKDAAGIQAGANARLRTMGFSQATINNPFYHSMWQPLWQLEKAGVATVITLGRVFRGLSSALGKLSGIGGVAMGLSIHSFLKQGSAEAMVFESALARVKDGWARVGGEVFKTRISMPKIPFINIGGGPSRNMYEWAEYLAKWLNSIDPSKIREYVGWIALIVKSFVIMQGLRWAARMVGEIGHLTDRALRLCKAIISVVMAWRLLGAAKALNLIFSGGKLVAAGGEGSAIGAAAEGAGFAAIQAIFTRRAVAEGAGFAAMQAIFARRAAGGAAMTALPAVAGAMNWSSASAAVTSVSAGFSQLGVKIAAFAGGIAGWILAIPTAISGFVTNVSLGAVAVYAGCIMLAAGVGAAVGSLLRLIPAVEHAADWFANLFYGDPEEAKQKAAADEVEWRKGDEYKAYQAWLTGQQPRHQTEVAAAQRRITLRYATEDFQKEHEQTSEFKGAYGVQTGVDEYAAQWQQANTLASKLGDEIGLLQEKQKGLNRESAEYKNLQEQIDAFDKQRTGLWGIQKTAISEVTSQIEKQASAEEGLSEAKESKSDAIARITEDTADRIADLKERKPTYSKTSADQLGDSLSKSLITSWEKRREIERAEKREAKELTRINDPDSSQNRAIRHAEENLNKLGELFTQKIVELFRTPSSNLKEAAEALQKMYRQMHPLSNGM